MIFFFRCVVLIFILCGCSGTQDGQKREDSFQKWKENNGKIKVLSTIGMINDLVQNVGKEYIDTLTLIQGELDPHSYQLVKGDGEKLAYADLIFYNGLGLEHGASLQHYLHREKNAVALGNYIRQKSPVSILYCHGQPDPHIWMDVLLWAETIPAIVEALSAKDPKHATEFQKNGERLREQLVFLDLDLKKQLGSLPQEKRYLVTSHDAFNYFAKAYLATPEEIASNSWQKRFEAPEGLAPDSQLCSTDIQHILDHVALHDIHVLFPETNVSKDSIKKILAAGEEKGLVLRIATPPLYGDAMGRPGSDGDSYEKMMRHNASSIANELSY